MVLLDDSVQGGLGILAGKLIQAAGGIVVRKGARPLIAIVQRSKDDRWVLPRGKLKRSERAVVGARREVVEETGHRVEVREYLGAITYRAQGRPKVVQFWRMQAAVRPSHDLMKDIAAVEWLPLKGAVRRLFYPLEKLFLKSVGRYAILGRKKKTKPKTKLKKHKKQSKKNKKRRR
jgi:8-oxo-dGTP diphosphatase